MSDYMDLINGTLKNLAEKVRDAAETTGVREVYEQGIERTKSYGAIAKLTVGINADTEELKRVYQEIGRLCYEEHKDAPEGFYAPLFSQVDELNAAINAKRNEIDALKGSIDSSAKSDVDVEICEFEDIVNNTEADGCGKE